MHFEEVASVFGADNPMQDDHVAPPPVAGRKRGCAAAQ